MAISLLPAFTGVLDMEPRWDKNQGISSNYFLMIFYVSGPIWDIWRGDSPGLWLPSLVRSSCVRRRRRSWWKEKSKNEPKTEMKAKSPPWAYCAQGRRRKEKPVEEGKYDNGFNGLVIEKTRILWQGWLEKGTKNVPKSHDAVIFVGHVKQFLSLNIFYGPSSTAY